MTSIFIFDIYSPYLLKFLELLEPCSHVLRPLLEVLQIGYPVPVAWRVERTHGQRRSDAESHVVQERVHSGDLPLVHDKPPTCLAQRETGQRSQVKKKKNSVMLNSGL